MPEQTLICRRCGQTEPHVTFRKHRRICNWCLNLARLPGARARYHENKAPTLEKMRAYYQRNREQKLATQKRYRELNREKVLATQKRTRLKHLDVARDRARRAKLKKYGLTIAAFEALVIAQGGQCLICQVAPARLDVDHCHESGAVRGLLCGNCNRAIGLFKHDPARLRAAIAYLEPFAMAA